MVSYPLSRFERQIDIPEVGRHGQEKLFQSSALVVGMGGLGCPAALYLAAAGIGRLGLADADTIDISNLHRQILYKENDIGQLKTSIAAQHLQKLASACIIDVHPLHLDQINALRIIEPYDIILDCTDNFETRLLLNTLCYQRRKKLISASLYYYDGQISVFKPFEGDDHPCYECLYDRATTQTGLAPECRQAGIMGPVAGTIGSLQASVAVNELLNIGESLSGWLLMMNLLTFNIEKIRLHKKKNCPCCAA